MLIPPPLCGVANARGGGTSHEIDDMLWAAVEPIAVECFAITELLCQNGQGRDKRPTRRGLKGAARSPIGARL